MATRRTIEGEKQSQSMLERRSVYRGRRRERWERTTRRARRQERTKLRSDVMFPSLHHRSRASRGPETCAAMAERLGAKQPAGLALKFVACSSISLLFSPTTLRLPCSLPPPPPSKLESESNPSRPCLPLHAPLCQQSSHDPTISLQASSRRRPACDGGGRRPGVARA